MKKEEETDSNSNLIEYSNQTFIRLSKAARDYKSDDFMFQEEVSDDKQMKKFLESKVFLALPMQSDQYTLA